MTANTPQTFRIEYHGLATPIGVAATEGGAANTAKARFFINGTKYATITDDAGAHFPSAASNLTNINFQGYCTGVVSATFSVGPVRCTYNRYLDNDAL